MKRLLSLVLIAVMIFALCACGEAKTSTAPAENPAEPAAAPAETPASVSQAQIIYNNLPAVTSNGDYNNFYFTVTDLDHNGRLELLAAVTEGTGNFTRGVAYEVTPSLDSIAPIDVDLGAAQALPEIITSSADTYLDSTNTYNYVFTDTQDLNSGDHYVSIVGLALKDGKITLTPIAHQDVEMVNGITVYEFSDGDGRPLNLTSLNDFMKQPDVKYSGASKSTSNFSWTALSNITSSAVLDQCYSVFSGEPAPLVNPAAPAAPVATLTPAVVQTPAPTPTIQIVDVNPQITKNPTSESLYEGGSCQFVAKADYYNYMAWSLIDPSGNIYGATTTPYSQLSVSGANNPCLTLNNVPLALNGWRARATFYGSTNVSSSDAYIYVSQAPVVVKTVTASPSSGYFTNYSNIVYLYSSTGENIHYEAIKSCDTGAYASENISSGSPIYINGIDGQYITVEVYANVIGSDKTYYFTYTVDTTPAPVPTYDPGYSSVRGSLGTQETMSTIPVFINGGQYQVSLDNITPQGSDLYTGRGCTCYYTGSLSSSTIYSVVLDP